MTKFEQLRGLCYLAADLLLIRTLIPFCAQLIRPDISLAAQNFFYFLFGFAAVLWMFRDFLRLNVRHFRLFPKQILLTALVGICSYLALTELVGTLTVLLYPQFLNFNDSAISVSRRPKCCCAAPCSTCLPASALAGPTTKAAAFSLPF